MGAVRNLVRQHKRLAFVLVACVLFAKVMIPSGFMPAATSHGIVIQICTGMGPAALTMTIPGLPAPHDGHKGGKAESPCAFAGLNAPSLAGADPFLLAIAVLFVMAMGMRAVRPQALSSTDHLRPPLRGPPARA
ncbi:hypothetical protein GCM10009087_53060 [Sphingomonas oligophenolica]|uniref:DUF2946 domain-containing protein n=1 Tax=Sphingomonas oligophenolica TaxID=301154 RepID=A0ABU9Y7F7_9SPHN